LKLLLVVVVTAVTLTLVEGAQGRKHSAHKLEALVVAALMVEVMVRLVGQAQPLLEAAVTWIRCRCIAAALVALVALVWSVTPTSHGSTLGSGTGLFPNPQT
jgi:hypothetical protein